MLRPWIPVAALALAAVHPLPASNLVVNPSFESFSACPNNAGQINHATGWSSPSLGSPDYMNACAPAGTWSTPSHFYDTQTPASGVAYALVRLWGNVPPNTTTDYREYVQGTLTQPLIAGHTYQVSFLVSLVNINPSAVVEIGAYLSPTPINHPNGEVIPVTPQVVNTNGFLNNLTGWMTVSGTFVATGGESYIVIGNFLDDATTTASNRSGLRFGIYEIDDVGVADLSDVPEPSTAALVALATFAAIIYGASSPASSRGSWRSAHMGPTCRT